MSTFRVLVLLCAVSCSLLHGTEAEDAKVVIVGGGPAGIEAAATLRKNGIEDYIILEPTDSLRGYLKPVEFGGRVFAPGYIWGYTPCKANLDKHNVTYKETDYSSYVAYDETGADITMEVMERDTAMNDAFDAAIESLADDIENGIRPDISQKAVLARGGWVASNAIDRAVEWYTFDFYEGLSPYDVSAYSSFKQYDLLPEEYLILDDRTLFHAILGEQEAGLDMSKVHFNQKVISLDQTDEDRVMLTTQHGSTYNADFVILTSTVGVLQNGGVKFEPALPAWKMEEIFRYQMATIDMILLQFEEKFWDDTEYIIYASDQEGYFPLFLNWEADGLLEAGTNILSAFVTGDEAYRMELMTDDEVQAEVLEVLKTIYGDTVTELTDFYMTRFATDENLYGNFASHPIGTVPEDSMMRLKSHVGRIYFAPEDSGNEYIGLPCGSVLNGRMAANAVASCYNDDVCDEYAPKMQERPPLCIDVKPGNPKKFRKRRP